MHTEFVLPQFVIWCCFYWDVMFLCVSGDTIVRGSAIVVTACYVASSSAWDSSATHRARYPARGGIANWKSHRCPGGVTLCNSSRRKCDIWSAERTRLACYSQLLSRRDVIDAAVLTSAHNWWWRRKLNECFQCWSLETTLKYNISLFELITLVFSIYLMCVFCANRLLVSGIRFHSFFFIWHFKSLSPLYLTLDYIQNLSPGGVYALWHKP